MSNRTRQLVGLDWSNEAISVAEMRFVRGQLEVRQSFRSEWPQEDFARDPERTGKWLRDMLQQKGMSVGKAFVSLPREETILKLVSFPTSDPHEVARMASLQMSHPCAENGHQQAIQFDYLTQTRNSQTRDRRGDQLIERDSQSQVLYCSVPSQTLNGIRSVCRAAGIIPVSIGVGELVLNSLDRRTKTSGGLSLDVLANNRKIEFVFAHDGVAIGSNSYPLLDTSPEVLRAMPAMAARILLGLPDDFVSDGIESIRMFGSKAEVLLPSFESYFDVPIEHFEFDHSVSAQLYAQASAIACGNSRIDFESPQHRQYARGPNRNRLRFTAIAACLALVLGYAYIAQNAKLDAQIERLKQARAELAQKIDQGQPTLAAHAKFTKWNAQKCEWPRAWLQLDELLPDHQRAYLHRVQWRLAADAMHATVLVTGYARKASDVQETNSRFVERPDFELQPKSIERGIDDEYDATFEIQSAGALGTSDLSMQVSRREKYLAAGAVCLLACLAAYRILSSSDSVWSAKQREILQLESQLAGQERVVNRIESAERNLAEARSRSLSVDLSRSATEYQNWLLATGATLRIADLSVVPKSPVRVGELGHRLPFVVRSDLTSLQLGTFLDTFYGLSTLHRITDLTVSSIETDPTQADGRRQAALKIEVLVLDGATRDASLEHVAISSDTSMRRFFENRDPFRRFKEVKEPARTVVVSTPKVVVDPLETITLVGTFAKAGTYEAWLYDSRLKTQYIAVAGKAVRIAEQDYFVARVGADFIEFQRRDGPMRVRFGESMSRVEETGTSL